jgi:AhpD family alkylhydroperoxidase
MTITNPPSTAPVQSHRRLDLSEASPDAYKAVLGVEQHARRTVDHTLYHLVKLRASMTNGCAYCVDMHSRDALAAGETTARLFGLAAWHDAPFFTERERAVLALTDAVTELPTGGVPDEVWDEAARHFDDRDLANLLIAIGVINLWNRIAIPTRIEPASERSA